MPQPTALSSCSQATDFSTCWVMLWSTLEKQQDCWSIPDKVKTTDARQHNPGLKSIVVLVLDLFVQLLCSVSLLYWLQETQSFFDNSVCRTNLWYRSLSWNVPNPQTAPILTPIYLPPLSLPDLCSPTSGLPCAELCQRDPGKMRFQRVEIKLWRVDVLKEKKKRN